MAHTEKKQLTSYLDINEILVFIESDIQKILADNLIGIYLFGSLTYGDFNYDNSDIDLVTIIKKPLIHDELQQIKQLHKQIEMRYPKWSQRLECSYTPVEMLKNILPPENPRPYYGGGIFYEEAPYGNEWIINNYLLYQSGIAISGPNFKTLIQPIDVIEVQKACIRDLFQEWEPKINDHEWLSNSHYQAYLVLNLCRILYTVNYGKTGTKKASAEWVKNTFRLWTHLIEMAENWKYGQTMSMNKEAIEFLEFVIDNIKKAAVYEEFFSK